MALEKEKNGQIYFGADLCVPLNKSVSFSMFAESGYHRDIHAAILPHQKDQLKYITDSPNMCLLPSRDTSSSQLQWKQQP